ncbi:MAG: hypothetical protein HZC47_00850 [Methanobacterium sp.]|uniref:hypothetical protein n=1 Tax=Methanobacterium sp. TaxID=2164 RepID=UPI003D65925D|nr:hypothetical protein [Methanobacterium sp.]
MKKNIVLIAGIVFMFVIGLQLVEPVSAAKLKVVDQGTTTLNDPSGNTITFTWKTYQRGTKYVAVIGYMYSPQTDTGVTMYMYLKKVSKKKVKLYGKMIAKHYGTGASYSKKIPATYEYTELTAAQCYWNEFKPGMMSGMPG